MPGSARWEVLVFPLRNVLSPNARFERKYALKYLPQRIVAQRFVFCAQHDIPF